VWLVHEPEPSGSGHAGSGPRAASSVATTPTTGETRQAQEGQGTGSWNPLVQCGPVVSICKLALQAYAAAVHVSDRSATLKGELSDQDATADFIALERTLASLQSQSCTGQSAADPVLVQQQQQPERRHGDLRVKRVRGSGFRKDFEHEDSYCRPDLATAAQLES